MKYKWLCNICGRQGRVFRALRSIRKNIITGQMYNHGGIIDLSFIRSDNVVKTSAELLSHSVVRADGTVDHY